MEEPTKLRRLLQLHVIHRHGDRTPITPLTDHEFWESQLIPQSTLDRISKHTSIVRDPEKEPNRHGARGRGPFGQLTRLGLLQMIQVGTHLRETYSSSSPRDDKDDEDDNPNVLWTLHQRPLVSSSLRVYSTDFARTIQSVQGLLVGLFPDEQDLQATTDPIVIDVRHTSILIPDPQPRRTHEQVVLEQALALRPNLRQREQEMMPLALRTSQILQTLLGPDAHQVAFGVDQEHPGDQEVEVQPLAWNQLAEICKCLSVYERLPSGISPNDVEAILHYAAQRWFQNLRHPRLNYLAMNALVTKQLESLCDTNPNHPPLTIWSAHDSTLIGLICAYRLEYPTEWPDYASHLILEKWEGVDGNEYVRFSWNGQCYLNCTWDDDEAPMECIRLSTLVEKIQSSTGGSIHSSSH